MDTFRALSSFFSIAFILAIAIGFLVVAFVIHWGAGIVACAVIGYCVYAVANVDVTKLD